jgi:hypothetical protein
MLEHKMNRRTLLAIEAVIMETDACTIFLVT